MFVPEIRVPDFKPITKQIAEENYASKFAEKILDQIQQFDNDLGNDFEVGVRLVSFGQTVVFAVHSISYNDPSLIIFNGVTDGSSGSPIELIQHVSQISFLLTSLPRQNKEEPKRTIGFKRQDV